MTGSHPRMRHNPYAPRPAAICATSLPMTTAVSSPASASLPSTAGSSISTASSAPMAKAVRRADSHRDGPTASRDSVSGTCLTKSHLKKRILVQDQGGAELQPAGILKYVEDLKRGPNTEVGPKDFFEIASSTMIFTMILLLGLQPAWHQTRPKNYILVRLLLGS